MGNVKWEKTKFDVCCLRFDVNFERIWFAYCKRFTMPTIQTFKDIRAWEKSIALAKQIYITSGMAPFCKDKPLQEQIRKAALSIASNIAEGFEREGNREFIQFLAISKGSAAEVQTQIKIAYEIGYISEDDFEYLDELCGEVIGLIAGFMKYLRSSGIEGQKFNRS